MPQVTRHFLQKRTPTAQVTHPLFQQRAQMPQVTCPFSQVRTQTAQGTRPFSPQRKLFWVYGVFIVLTITGLGALTLLHATAMAAGEPVARSIAAFTGIFWFARLVVQWAVFDARPFLTNGWLKFGYHVLTVAFTALVAVYAVTVFALR